MKYLVEINSDSEKGSKLMKYIERLDATDKDVHILNEPLLTDEEVALPTKRSISKVALENYLKPDSNEEGFTPAEALAYIQKKRTNKKRLK